MPIYEFLCGSCGLRRGWLMPLSSSGLRERRCDCGGRARRVVSVPRLDIWRPMRLPDIPMEITSRRQYDEALKVLGAAPAGDIEIDPPSTPERPDQTAEIERDVEGVFESGRVIREDPGPPVAPDAPDFGFGGDNYV